ncbi:MAG: hypothetical protein ACREQW_05845 [Candidatus Binatia bacterium]
MKFDVEIPTLDAVARLEIRSAKDEHGWSSYLAFVSGRKLDETCLLLGESGVPYRFTGTTQKKAEEKAKDFLEGKYRVVRTIW